MHELTPFIILIFALLIDYWFAEPSRAHPLVGLGYLANTLETILTQGHRQTPSSIKIRGIVAVTLLTLSGIGSAVFFTTLTDIGIVFELFILYFCIGHQSLKEHASAVILALQSNNVTVARHKVAMLVSRDTAHMTHQHIARATIESVLENGNDAVFAVIFWYLIAGAPGALLYRISNTLDAMWGYRTTRYLHFGWAAAKLDDLLNWIPARLCAATYALMGHTEYALQCWRQQSKTWDSPNAGPVLAAGAGALNIQLGGPAIYHNQPENKPLLGTLTQAGTHDILRAINLVQHSLILWIILLGIGFFFAL